jgi:uncharacterized protein (DUF885 family)
MIPRPAPLLCSVALILAAPVSAAPAKADAAFRKIAESEYRWRKLQEGPDEDSANPAEARLPDVGPKAQAEALARWTRAEAELERIRPTDLSPAERTNYQVYKAQIDALLASQRFRDYEKPLNSDTSFWGEIAGLARGEFRSERSYRNYITELREVPRYFDQQIDNMRAGLKRGFTPPKITLQGRDVGVAEIANAADSEKTVFFEPFKTFPVGMPSTTQAQLREQAKAVIRDAVIPAHAKLLKFLRDEYIPGARTTIAAYDLPDGKAYYQSKIREFVTLDLPPEKIHAIGLAEVARIRARMLDVMKEVGFKGDLPAFLQFLRTDPQFYAKTPQELLNDAAWLAKTFDGKASQWFGRLPRSRFAVKPVPPEIAPYYTGGRGGPGIYLVNTYNLPSRPLYSLPALTLHESAPGHAFQMPLAAENKALPDYRRETYISAYGEGWALYSEALGEEMGMYKTPYETFGMLSYQMWRAARLVVDTGIHSQGWTRERAQKYLHDNTALADHEIETEVDRYIAWPGQALSYYMGELEIRKARAKAEQKLGPKFNIRAFHDAVLELGSVPLPVIDERVDRLIAAGGKGPYPDDEK